MRILSSLLFVAAGLLAAGCAHHNPYYDAARPHHRPEGFANNYPPNPAYRRPPQGFLEGWASRIRNWTSDGSERLPLAPIPVVEPDLAYLHANAAEPALTWIGHATFLFQTGAGMNILTDPVFRSAPRRFPSPDRSATSRPPSPWPRCRASTWWC
jgi:hypothetical protein